jgi:hypothetical protein
VKNQVAIDGLRVKLNEISNAIRGCEQQIARLMADKATIHAALKVMGSDSNEGAVALGIQRGAFSRTILEVLREADEPMGVRDIAAALMKRSGKDLAGHEFDLVVARVRNVVPRMAEQLEGELRGRATFWRVRETFP